MNTSNTSGLSHDVQIAPSILDSDLATLDATLKFLASEDINVVHIDVMDGNFVPNISVGLPVVRSIRQHTELLLDVHLMIDRPERYVAGFVDAGADIVTVHAESTPHVHRALQTIRQAGAKAGLVLNPGTPIGHALGLLEGVDLILIMSVNPGYGGQQFILQTLERLATVRHEIDSRQLDVVLEVDGGINEHTLSAAVNAGAQWLVAGSAIFKHSDGPSAGLHRLQTLVQ